MKITVETRVSAPIAKVWAAYTSPEDIKQWNAASSDWHTTQAAADLRLGWRIFISDGGQGRQHRF